MTSIHCQTSPLRFSSKSSLFLPDRPSKAAHFSTFALMLSLSSVLLAALTFLSWPSGPRPWLRLLTTSPTELQIGWHTMPQILIQRHNAPTRRTPCTLFNATSLLSILSFFSTTFPFFRSTPAQPSWPLGTPVGRQHLPPYWSAGQRECTSQRSQSRRCRREKQRWPAPSFKPGPLRQLPPPHSH